MPSTLTDKKMIKEVLTRGVEKIYPSYQDLEKKLLSGERLRLYCGYDPSAPALHIGNAISLNKLAQFQALGHEVIFLVGDFTGMIGDPTDKQAARKKLSRDQVLANAKDYQAQASAYLKFEGSNPARVEYNSRWNDKLNFQDLIELASHFTVQQMIQRDMFQSRLQEEKPIYLHEFLYPLTQGYDSVALDVDLEVGGNDQMFNMLCGRQLLKDIKQKEKFVLTMKLLADESGKKMGKSEGNVIFLNEAPKDMYGQVMSWPDSLICPAFELCTNEPLAEIAKMAEDMVRDRVNPRDLKMRLARAITGLVHGADAAAKAEASFVSTIQKKETPTEMPVWEAGATSYALTDLLVESGLCASKTEARRLIEQGGIKMDKGEGFEVAKDPKLTVKIGRCLTLQRGRLQFVRVVKAG